MESSGLEDVDSNSSSSTSSLASTPSIIRNNNQSTSYTPNIITSIDCKILQYQYGIIKLEQFISNLKRLQQLDKPTELPLIHYIVLTVGNVFAINDKAFDSKLDLLSNYKLFKLGGNITITSTTSHIPYDTPDTVANALETIPSIGLANKCLKSLEVISNHCLQGYKRRLTQAKLERQALNKSGEDFSKYYETLLQITNEIVLDEDFDLKLNDLTFMLPTNNLDELLENEDLMEATLIDMDIKQLFNVISQVESIINKTLRPLLNELKQPASPIDRYSLHRIFMLTLRLNEIYTIFRRFGRKIFLPTYEHLTDSNFLCHSKNQIYFKTTIINSLNDIFNSQKKNGTFIATLTRFIRQGAKFEINEKTLSNHITFISQGLFWYGEVKRQQPQLRESTSVGTPPIGSSPRGTPPVGSSPRGTPPPAAVVPENNKPEPFPSLTNKIGSEKAQNNGQCRYRCCQSARSRSSNLCDNTINQTSSPKRNRPQLLIVPPGRASPTRAQQRPTSMLFLNPNLSTSNVQSSNEGTEDTTVKTRRRSNSQPIGRNDLDLASSGAALALTRNGSLSVRSPLRGSPITANPSSSLSSPTEISRRKAIDPSSLLSPTSPTRTKLIDEPKMSTASSAAATATAKLSANQRFQQHIKQAAKSGSLVTHQREQLHSVTFDPNNTSKLQIRKYVEVKPSPPPQAPSQEPEVVMMGGIPIGSTISKPPRVETYWAVFPQPGSISSSSEQASTSTSGSGKKVRFVGVPAWTEQEDAPTKYSNIILKNFARLQRGPVAGLGATPRKARVFMKSDELLKEESKAFKAHQGLAVDDDVPVGVSGIASPSRHPLRSSP
ncbi:uncharacterized protein J8A68_003672 [[Candida] subhashii]|uniref:Uncharacterized protein n=1 Tax=[Candida] subhashii TaxID=561895 RepID=A0A8J5QIR9_9ASCO|nr:uncharacterized protein J8A68_003672 [[Candida] subhashii]KAG7662818.1 hypothetical protein J8A68_003672 [[Candida] subhashii]